MTIGQADQGGSVLGEVYAGNVLLHVLSCVDYIELELHGFFNVRLRPVRHINVFEAVHCDLKPGGSSHRHRRQHHQRQGKGESSF